MRKRQFRFSYFTPRYESTVAFYRDGLGLPILESWRRSRDDRGTLFAVASGVIEVLARPKAGSSHLWDDRPPQGVFAVIEVNDVDREYRRAVRRGLPVRLKLTDQEWGHRSFCLVEPNGLVLYLFSAIRRPRAGRGETSLRGVSR